MDRRYHCFIYIFEPVFEFSKGISERFKNNSNIKVFSWGLSDQDKKTFLTLSDDGSSEFKTTKDSIEIDLVQASRFLKEQNISRIDLMKINIEGGEYDLLEHLIAQGWITRITNLQIQFHDFVPKAKERMLKIQQNLKKTHSLTYHFEFVWENWRLKESV
jgi:FkbM family methyltransferase